MSRNGEEGRQSNASADRFAWRRVVLNRIYRVKNHVRRYWWVLLLIGLGAFIGQAARQRFESPSWVSTGRLIVNVKLSIPEGSLYSEELNNFLGTQAALMQSAVVVERARERLAEQFSALDDEGASLKAVIQPRTTIFLLQGTGRNERYTQAFVQACMEEYIRLKQEMRAQTSDSTLAGLTEQVLRLERELRRCDEEWVAFSSTNSVVLFPEQGNTAANYLAGLTQRLAGLKSEFALLRLLDPDQALEGKQQPGSGEEVGDDMGLCRSGGQLRFAGDREDGGNSTSPTSRQRPEEAALPADAEYLRARQQLLVLKAEREELGRDLRPAHPKMVSLTEDIGRRERLLGIYRRESAEQLERRKESLRLQIGGLEQETREWEARALEMSRRGAELQRIKANTQRTQALYDRLLAAIQTLDVNKQISPESVTIMEKAGPALPQRRGLGKLFWLTALGSLAAMALVLGLIDRMDDRVGSVTELQELFREEVLGQIPRERNQESTWGRAVRQAVPTPLLLRAQDERYGLVEAFRNLRSTLIFLSASGERARTLVVSSSVPGEGKSVVASNLAITLAQAGARVLLVDADLRKGSLGDRLGLEAEGTGLGLAGMLEERIENEEDLRAAAPSRSSSSSFVRATKVDNLFLLPRGAATDRASELFLSERTKQFLEQARCEFEFVILDTAPVMAADDVTSLAPRVDGVLFVLRAEQTSARVARAALDLLYLRNVRVLGLVFNAVRTTSAGYYAYDNYKDVYGSQKRV